jgi:putative nucleotidyltransferase with HDIG domain
MQTQSDPALELIGLVQRLSLARSLPEIQTIVRTGARRLTGADGATFVLRDGDKCFYADEDAIEPLWKGQRFPLGQCISGWAMNNRSPVAIEDIYVDDRIPHAAYRPTFVKSLAMVPIRRLDPVGAIGNYWAEMRVPTDHELDLLQALADSTAVAIENVQVYEQLDAARTETLQCLARAAEYRDGATYEHTERVADLAARIAAELGWDADRVALLRLAAPLHDIGKLAVSDAVLLKAGKLTRDEFEQVKVHAEAGASILSDAQSDVLRMGREVARAHHEWWDGSGYPYGLSGSAIPEAGRIVALADVYDALTSPRPYKEAWPHQRARDELTRLRGRQFDPDVVDAFLRLT